MNRLSEIKKIVKQEIMENGKITPKYTLERIRNCGFECDSLELQNACNYFRYSPQQAKFREKYNFN